MICSDWSIGTRKHRTPIADTLSTGKCNSRVENKRRLTPSPGTYSVITCIYLTGHRKRPKRGYETKPFGLWKGRPIYISGIEVYLATILNTCICTPPRYLCGQKYSLSKFHPNRPGVPMITNKYRPHIKITCRDTLSNSITAFRGLRQGVGITIGLTVYSNLTRTETEELVALLDSLVKF